MTRIPSMPPSAPRTGNRFTRWIGRSILRLGGWTIAGDWPDVPRMVVIAAPHSSGWDAVWGLAAKVALGVEITFIAKAELFWGPLGWLLRKFGGAHGRPKRGFTDEAVAALEAYEWPGNVRELENKVKTAMIMAEGSLITAEDRSPPPSRNSACAVRS